MKRRQDGTHEPGLRRAGQGNAPAEVSQAELDAALASLAAIQGTVQTLYEGMSDQGGQIGALQNTDFVFFEGAPPGNLYAITQSIAAAAAEAADAAAAAAAGGVTAAAAAAAAAAAQAAADAAQATADAAVAVAGGEPLELIRYYAGDLPNNDATIDIATGTVRWKAGGAITPSAPWTYTLGTNGALNRSELVLIRTSAVAFTLTIVNGGPAGGVLLSWINSLTWQKAIFLFDGTNWFLDRQSVLWP